MRGRVGVPLVGGRVPQQAEPVEYLISPVDDIELTVDYHARPADWRWRRAVGLTEARRRTSRTRDDRSILEAVSFLKVLRSRRNSNAQLALRDRYPGMFEAWCLGTRPGSVLQKHETEARLLAGESTTEISKKVGLSDEVIERFEEWFFNVTDRLHCPGWVIHVVLGKSIHEGVRDRDYDLLWKLYGYHGGPHVLDAMLYNAENPIRPDDPGQVGAYCSDAIRSKVRRKAVMMLDSDTTSHRVDLILDIYTRCVEAEKAAGIGGANESMMQNVSAFLDGLPWLFGESDKELPFTAAFDKAGVSMSSHELVDLATGQSIPSLKSITSEFKFPTDA